MEYFVYSYLYVKFGFDSLGIKAGNAFSAFHVPLKKKKQF